MQRNWAKRLCVLVGFLLLALCMSGGEVQASSSSLYYKPYEDASYELEYEVGEDESITITGYTGTAGGELVLPAEIDGMTVTGIGASAFRDCSGFTGELIIPEGVTSIENMHLKVVVA